jgi:N-acetylglucosamine-6-phosphate deacetylase
VNEDRAVLRDGTLAGSILKLNDAAKNMMAYTGCTLQDIIQMAAVNPAKQINVYDRKGSIAKGKDADLVVLNDRLEVVMTFCRGKLTYSQQEM